MNVIRATIKNRVLHNMPLPRMAVVDVEAFILLIGVVEGFGEVVEGFSGPKLAWGNAYLQFDLFYIPASVLATRGYENRVTTLERTVAQQANEIQD